MEPQHLHSRDMFPDLHPLPEDLAELLASLPDNEQVMICRGWDTCEHYYTYVKKRATGMTYVEFNYQLNDRYTDEPWSVTSWQRVHRKYPQLAPWPIRPHMCLNGARPWIRQDSGQQGEGLQDEVRRIRASEADRADESEAVAEEWLLRLEDYGHRNEIIHEKLVAQDDLNRFIRVLRLLRTSSIAAVVTVSSFLLLDYESDGMVNGVITWCHVLAQHVLRG